MILSTLKFAFFYLFQIISLYGWTLIIKNAYTIMKWTDADYHATNFRS